MSFDHAHAGGNHWRSGCYSLNFQAPGMVGLVNALVTGIHAEPKDEEELVWAWPKALF